MLACFLIERILCCFRLLTESYFLNTKDKYLIGGEISFRLLTESYFLNRDLLDVKIEKEGFRLLTESYFLNIYIF